MGSASLRVALLLMMAFCNGGVPKQRHLPSDFPIALSTHMTLGLMHFAPTGSCSRTLTWNPGKESQRPWQRNQKSQRCIPWFPASNIIVSSTHPIMGRGGCEQCFSFFMKLQQVLYFRIWTLKGDPLTVASDNTMTKHTTLTQDIIVMDLSA